MEEFLYKLIPTRPDFINTTKEEDEILSQHFTYLEGLLDNKELILAGPCLDGSLGIVILRAESEKRARSIMEGDPAVINGLMQATLQRYRVSLMGSK
ncbi:YciI family protein [Pseudalkalibacillus sp. R45]|uniref:YciI family protein n=1 Tax=Pseudalkalibacillus sp. R45 TaxID=3457433 RepID=UPI003FCE1758